MGTSQSGANLHRRRFLQTATILAGSGALTGLSGTANAQEVDLREWFSNVSNYDGLIDERGQSEITVAVGAAGNGGAFAFEPAAVRVDRGTTITWEWSGEGGRHDVAAEDDSFGSDLQGDAGDTFQYTFEDEDIARYACTPHKSMGMKGAVVVGDAEVPGLEGAQLPFVAREPDYGHWFDNTAEFEGTLDMRGREEVRIECLADETAGEFAFSPPAVHVDPGTRVIWEWEGDVTHSVAAANGGYASPDRSAGEWGLRFDGVGISRYASSVYGGQGMRGAIVVGDVSEGIYTISTSTLTVMGSLGAAFFSPLAFGIFIWRRGLADDSKEHRAQ